MSRNDKFFPEMITGLKQADLGVPGATVWTLNVKDSKQIAIMQLDQDFLSVEPHTNKHSQWGIILSGEVTLYTDRERKLKKGDTFFIPAGVAHKVKIKAGYKDVTIFDGPRYKAGASRLPKGGD